MPLEFGGFRFLSSETDVAFGTGLLFWLKNHVGNSESTSSEANGLSFLSASEDSRLRMGNHAGKRDFGAEKGNKVRSEPLPILQVLIRPVAARVFP